MNIDKIKNYNQKMLAVICTLGVLILFFFLALLVKDFWPSRDSYNAPEGLISDEKTEVLNQENLRKQVISYDSPWLIDTLKSIYIVPVAIQTLNKPEDVSGLLGLMDVSSSARFSKGGYYSSKTFRGKYANLILYDAEKTKATSLFQERIIIGNIETLYFEDDILLVFFGASKDTDKSGLIDLDDLRTLYVYSLHTGVTRKIADGDNSPVRYKFMENSKNMLVDFELGNYKANQFRSENLPQKVMRYDFDTQKLSNIIPEGIDKEMQKLVEGK